MFQISTGNCPSLHKEQYGNFQSISSHIKTVINVNGVRMWSDGTYAKSAIDYYMGDSTHQYAGDIGDGIYKILPEGSLIPIDVYCKMTDELGQGVGWMLLMISREGGTDLSYDDSSWTTFTNKNDTIDNINPNTNTTTNVLTKVATQLKISSMWIYALSDGVYYHTLLTCNTADYFSNISSMTIISKPSGWYSTLTTFQKNQSVDKTYDDYWVRFGGVIGINSYDAWGGGIGIKHVATGHVNHKSATAGFNQNLDYGISGVASQWANIWVK